MELTALETRVLVAHFYIACDAMCGETPDDVRADNFSWATAKELADLTGLKVNQIKGVTSSLVKKGLIGHDTIHGLDTKGTHSQENFYLHEEGLNVLDTLDYNNIDVRHHGEEVDPKADPDPEKVIVSPEEVKAAMAEIPENETLEDEAKRLFKEIRANNNVLTRGGKPKQKPSLVAIEVWLQTGGVKEQFVPQMAARKQKDEKKAALDYLACYAYLGE